MNAAKQYDYIAQLQAKLADIESEKVRLCEGLEAQAAPIREFLKSQGVGVANDTNDIPPPRDSQVRDLIPNKESVPYNAHKVEPLAAYRSDFEWMHATMRHLYKLYGRAITKQELWGELTKGSTRGGRAPSLAKTTFGQYLCNFASGKNHKGLILWDRVGHGLYKPR